LKPSIFLATYLELPEADQALLDKWARIRAIRDVVNKEIEALRADGQMGSSLQARVQLFVEPDDLALLQSLEADLKFAFITSAITLEAARGLSAKVHASNDSKCERCWHYTDTVGQDPGHPGICGRCVSNLLGSGETRGFA
jgi:isoleucyl-tRNA synthetase